MFFSCVCHRGKHRTTYIVTGLLQTLLCQIGAEGKATFRCH